MDFMALKYEIEQKAFLVMDGITLCTSYQM